MARSVLDLLLEIQLIDDHQHEDVLSRATSAGGGHLIQATCELGYATESSLARALVAELGLQRAELAADPEPAALELLDARTCRERFVLPLSLHENGALLWVAMADPTDKDTIGLLSRKTQRRVRPLVAGPTELLRAVARLYPGGKPATGPIPPAAAPPASARPVARFEEPAEEAPSPLARIAAALGVRIPQRKPAAGTGSRAAPAGREARAQPAGSGGLVNDLSDGDLETLEALRASLDKGALVLRAITELCVEKGVLAGDEVEPGS